MAEILADLLQKMAGKLHDVVLPLPQRRHIDGEDAETIKEIFAKPAVFHGLVEIPVRGGHHSHADRASPVTAHLLEFSLLKYP